MKYNFEEAVDRSNTGSFKWDQMKDWNPNVGEGIAPFSVADMDLRNAPEITEGLAKFITSNVLGYTGPTESYYNAVCRWMKKRHNWEIKPEWITVYPGVVPAFFNAVKAYTKPDEGVIIMTPVYYPFYMAIETNGRKVIKNPLLKVKDRYVIDFEDLEKKAQDPNNKVLLFCSPHNPLGRVWEKEELQKVADICLKNNVLIISDEIHNDLIMSGYEHTVFATISDEVRDNMVVCTAPSKTFNLAGLVTSNIIIPNKELRDAFTKEAERSAINMVNVIGLKACEIAYTQCEDWLDNLLELINHNHFELKKYVEENMPKIKVYDLEGTYLQWMDFSALGMDKDQLEKFMHMEAQVFFDEGYLFGDEGECYERMNIACPTKTMMDALARIKDCIKKI